MGIPEKIKAIQDEMARTQINKATEHHLGLLKAKIAKLKREQEENIAKKSGVKSDGFDVRRFWRCNSCFYRFAKCGKIDITKSANRCKIHSRCISVYDSYRYSRDDGT